MKTLDWVILCGTLLFIVVYGVWKSRGVRDMKAYFRGDSKLGWGTIGLSVMATQASAITFLSTPGQGFDDGMRFVQFYFGLPLAMVVISAVFVPIYFRLKVYTAYEYLEHRFDARVRYFAAIVFLIQRGLGTALTIYAPAIILSAVLGWSVTVTTLVMGIVVILYTVSGGTQAVSQTQKQQMIVMLSGMAIAAVVIAMRLPEHVTMPRVVELAGALDRMNVITTNFDWKDRYNLISGLIGGFFLQLAYFGTDQSQVQRYLSGSSVTESRLGLLFNGMMKVPMQALILFIGVLVFVFFLFTKPPILFNAPMLERVAASEHGPALQALQGRYDAAFEQQRLAAEAFVTAREQGSGDAEARTALETARGTLDGIRKETRALVEKAIPEAKKTKDADYVFLSFVLRYLPTGLVGLLVAVILCAGMSAIASGLSALGSTTTVDLWKRMRGESLATDPKRDLWLSRLFTMLWGVFTLAFALFASLLDNLIEAVNIIGSIFYPTVLGLFVVAFFFKRVTATPVFIAAIVAQIAVVGVFFTSDIGYLWYNVIGTALIVAISLILQPFMKTTARA